MVDESGPNHFGIRDVFGVEFMSDILCVRETLKTDAKIASKHKLLPEYRRELFSLTNEQYIYN